ncbi:hypothetical protein GRI89_06430 [Altererythrobacter salegens]|uniref:Uncharacterized protein n=1 Tax=Croceibacterium salegens TaxID=1737568 RepID=A0A6I4ST75_9SPHN|nr:hypothetical protein [Croceibacterium salegens]MXO59174.1 hypothetical protein [Croceibacterium salegens]
MKQMVLFAALAAIAIPALPAQAKEGDENTVNAKVVERDSKGKATKVEVNGKVYAVCSGTVQDECINPRQAGLNFGNEPLDHWPGKPASEGGK